MSPESIGVLGIVAISLCTFALPLAIAMIAVYYLSRPISRPEDLLELELMCKINNLWKRIVVKKDVTLDLSKMMIDEISFFLEQHNRDLRKYPQTRFEANALLFALALEYKKKDNEKYEKMIQGIDPKDLLWLRAERTYLQRPS